jgi:hypothetical protein
MKSYLTTLFAKFPRSHRPGGGPPKGQVRPEIELLERRDLLSASALAGGGLLVPAYAYPVAGGVWDQLASAARSVPVEAILNPDSGPGTGPDPNYVAAVNNLRAAGGTVIGYVPTNYGQPTAPGQTTAQLLQAVETAINDYHAWYHLDGIFIDEMATDQADLGFYQQIYNYVHSLQSGWTVVGNPGTIPAQSYVTAADTLVMFEDSAGANGANYSAYSPPAWQAGYPATRFANIVYGVSTVAAMQADVNQAAAQNTGWIYVTDADLPNPYGALPSYWGQLVAAVAAHSAATVAPPAAPSFTATAVSGTQVNLSWNPVANATNYYVDEWVNGGWARVGTLGSGGTSFAVTGLTPGTTYYFMVGAANAAGTTWANYQAVTTPAALAPPAAPSLTATTVSPTQVYLSWRPVSGATGYKIDEWIAGAWRQIAIVGGGGTGYLVNGLTPGTIDYFTIGAFNGAGTTWAPYYWSARA